MDITYPERVSRLKKFIGTGRLIRNKYTGKDAEGRQTACLLAALSPEVARYGKAEACPGDVMPRWMALLTVTIDDAGTIDAWDETIRRYSHLASQWHVLDGEAWHRLAARALQVALREAKPLLPEDFAEAVHERLESECAGEPMEHEELEALRDRLHAKGIRSSARKNYAAQTAGRALLSDVSDPCAAQEAWTSARCCRVGASDSKAVDRMTNLFFDAMQKEIDAAQ